ncbi:MULTISPECIES: MlaD family protein [Flammeovirga]|uniref:MCE family protein n=1 Tax=Flammeovirga agarivorans TaxID=2726742 RepID=A0A7X8XUQ7_9BACT|nr:MULTISPECIES: MlaD family protein [Flammeovirga]NLR90632.1 MCE family protein [Flammeovirga agarivorans]
MSTIKVELSNEVKVGLFAIICGLTLYVGYKFLKGIDVFSNQNTYYVIYDKTPDLQVSNNVTVNGYIVGRVSNMELLQDQNNKVRVTLDIQEGVSLYRDTKAVIADKGMLGDKQVKLIYQKNNALAKSGSILDGDVENGMFAQLSEKVDPLLASLEATLDTARIVLNGFKGTGAKLDGLLAETTETVHTVNSSGLDQTLHNFRDISEEFKSASQELQPLLAKMSHIADSINNAPLTQTVKEAEMLLANTNKTLEQINNPEGTVGALLTEREMHDQMVRTMSDLDSLFIDFKAHPKRYVHFSVFGKKDKAPKEEKKKDKK